jgi:hypothetical protein
MTYPIKHPATPLHDPEDLDYRVHRLELERAYLRKQSVEAEVRLYDIRHRLLAIEIRQQQMHNDVSRMMTMLEKITDAA